MTAMRGDGAPCVDVHERDSQGVGFHRHNCKPRRAGAGHQWTCPECGKRWVKAGFGWGAA